MTVQRAVLERQRSWRWGLGRSPIATKLGPLACRREAAQKSAGLLTSGTSGKGLPGSMHAADEPRVARDEHLLRGGAALRGRARRAAVGGLGHTKTVIAEHEQ